MTRYWVDTPSASFVVAVDGYGNIVSAPPKLDIWNGKPLSEFLTWAAREGQVQMMEI